MGALGGDAKPGPGAAAARAIAEGLLRLIAGNYDEAARVARESLESAATEGFHAYDASLLSIISVAKLFAGEKAEAKTALQMLEQQAARLRRGDRACLHYLRAWLAALDEDVSDALREAKLALVLASETGIPWFECIARIAIAQLHTGAGDRRGGEAHRRAAAAIAERLRCPWLSYAVELAAGMAAMRAGDETAAVEHVRTAFQQGQEHGFGPPPGFPARALADLCVLALAARVEPGFARAWVRDGRPLQVADWPWPFRIRTLGAFQCLHDDASIELSAKGPGRPMELLKVLLALGGKNVRADQLSDALWPNVEADYAYKSFTATLHRLRRMLGDDEALVLRDGRLTLNPARVWVVTWALEQLFDEFDATLRGADACANETLRRAWVERALELYRAPFLPDESEQPSYIACREQLRARLLRFLARVARGWEEAGASEAAADCYLRFIEADELYEPLYRQLMLCYKRGAAPIEAVAAYERLRTILSARLKVLPSPETQALSPSGPLCVMAVTACACARRARDPPRPTVCRDPGSAPSGAGIRDAAAPIAGARLRAGAW